ncbi:neuroglobin-like [Tubulanus polymorphus]|uniref:neuroglobin-like n=1 Tax=Tubulanus polymorphus TaxID=672921 RepID=UPI003DA49C5E
MGMCNSMYDVPLEWYSSRRHNQQNSADVLGDFQIEIIQKTWPTFSQHRQAVDTGCKIFMHMFANSPEIKNSFSFRSLTGDELYQNSVFRAHSANFMTLINDVVTNIYRLDETALNRLIPLGAKHGLINAFHPSYLKEFKKSVLYTWENVLGHSYTSEIHEAWSGLFEFMINNVANGYEAYELEKSRTGGEGPHDEIVVPIRMIEEYTR